MTGQEFLASFTVDIGAGGVTRLQSGPVFRISAASEIKHVFEFFVQGNTQY